MAERPVCVLIGALGGQGGGVLADWLTDAAQSAGFPAQATSIPGVAQRTGATTYYFELFPEAHPDREPVFSLFPSADELDLMVAMEPTEAGRALEKGWVTDITTVLTTTRRIYSTAEKSLAGDGRVDPLPVLDALSRASGSLILIEAEGAAQVNAMMLGAIAATGVLPLEPAVLRAAIEARGLAVTDNLEAFEAGRAMAAAGGQQHPAAEASDYQPAPGGFEAELARFPDALRPLLGHALARLVDYQDRDYARLYLNRLRPLVELDSAEQGFRLSHAAGRRLAAWMSYEDVPRVAQLKTRPGRLARLRKEAGAADDEPVLVYDYFKPRLDEIGAIMPRPFGGWMRGFSESHRDTGLRLRWPTATPLGYALLKLLAALRRWRGHGDGYQREQQAMESWLAAVKMTVPVDYDLAVSAAQLATWARGYGGVRQRGLAHLAGFWSAWRQRLDSDREALAGAVRASLEAAREDPDHPPAP